MKKWALALLCVFLAAAILGGGAAWLLLTPRGLLREDRPEDVMQGVLNDMRRDEWRDTYVRECPVETGEFEDSAEVTGRIFDAAVPGEEFSFRPSEDGTGETTQTYIISGGGVDLMRADLVYDSRHWNLALTGLCTLRGETRTITVTAPEGTALTLNGRPVGEQYIVERDIPYPDMTELELRFASHPTLVRYEIGGIYEAAELRAEREGGLTELYSDGTEWRYTLPEGGKYVFSVKAPLEAVVTVNGMQLTDREIAATTTYPTVLDIPQELEASLPSYGIYTAGGLYTEPVISAALPDGSELLSETAEDGSVAYTYPSCGRCVSTARAIPPVMRPTPMWCRTPRCPDTSPGPALHCTGPWVWPPATMRSLLPIMSRWGTIPSSAAVMWPVPPRRDTRP